MRGARSMLAVACAAVVACPVGAVASEPELVLLRDHQVAIGESTSSFDCPIGQTSSNCAQRDTQVEPSIAANPTDPSNAIAVYQEGRVDSGGAVAIGYATTFDAGRTWTYGVIPGISPAAGDGPSRRVSDPVVDFGPDGTAYVNTLLLDGGPARLSLSASRDGGATWEQPSILADAGIPSVDKNWMVVDKGSGPGHHPGRIYVVWDDIAPVLYAYTDDEGETWTFGDTGFPIYPGQGIGTQPLVTPDGDLVVIWTTLAYAPNPGSTGAPADLTGEKIVAAIAPAAGSVPTGAPIVFTPPVPVTTYRGRPSRGQRAGDGLPSAAVDPGSGALYVVWNDARFRDDDVNDIALSRSTDGGINWSAPARVNPQGTPYLDHSTPMIGVGPDGQVQVAYRRRQETQSDDPRTFARQIDTYLQVSGDGGETFSGPLKVSTPDSDMAFAAQSRGGAFLGDYDQLAPAGRLTYIVRTEPLRIDPDEPRRFPPAYHHQRAWVAVVGPPPAEEGPVVVTPKVLGDRELPRTGAAGIAVGAALLGIALAARALLLRADDEPARPA